MRILFIGESYLPQLCGMTAVTRYLAEGLVSRGHKVGIATQSHFDNDKNVEILNGVEINRFRIRRNLFCVVNMMYTYLSALGALHLIF